MLKTSTIWEILDQKSLPSLIALTKTVSKINFKESLSFQAVDKTKKESWAWWEQSKARQTSLNHSRIEKSQVRSMRVRRTSILGLLNRGLKSQTWLNLMTTPKTLKLEQSLPKTWKANMMRKVTIMVLRNRHKSYLLWKWKKDCQVHRRKRAQRPRL